MRYYQERHFCSTKCCIKQTSFREVFDLSCRKTQKVKPVQFYTVLRIHMMLDTDSENITSSAGCFSLPPAFPPRAGGALVSVARKEQRNDKHSCCLSEENTSATESITFLVWLLVVFVGSGFLFFFCCFL